MAFNQIPKSISGLLNINGGNIAGVININQISGNFGNTFKKVTAGMNLDINSIFKPQGTVKGDSKSTDSNGSKYPKGYTPPVDTYHNPSNKGESGLPVEYGYSMIQNGALMNSNGTKSKTNLVYGSKRGDQIINPSIKIMFENFKNGTVVSERAPETGTDGVEIEYLYDGGQSTPEIKRQQRLDVYDAFKHYSSKTFTHLLDYFIDQRGNIGDERIIPIGDEQTKSIYLGSFIRTTDDNEDPTMLGYDIEINIENSPLFNGELDSFISTYGAYNSEIKSRAVILSNFKEQLFKFLKVDQSVSQSAAQFLGPNGSGVKVYYLKNLGGLDNLSESNSGNTIKSFVKYGDELLTLQFTEDVSQNIGYLSSLYKSLAWSRINGKNIIPENLLRFDMDITITEIRKYNRVIWNKDYEAMDVYADLISKYVYRVNECQFFFAKLPHGDAIDLSAAKAVDTYDIAISYKFSTMKFVKFVNPDETQSYLNKDNQKVVSSLDNSKINVDSVSSNETNNSGVDRYNTIYNDVPVEDVVLYTASPNNPQSTATTNPDSTSTSGVTGLRNLDNKNNTPKTSGTTNNLFGNIRASLGVSKQFDYLQAQINGGIANKVNAQISVQALLLNKTLENIRNQVPSSVRSLDKLTGNSLSKAVEIASTQTGTRAKSLQDLVSKSNSSVQSFVGKSVSNFFQNK